MPFPFELLMHSIGQAGLNWLYGGTKALQSDVKVA